MKKFFLSFVALLMVALSSTWAQTLEIKEDDKAMSQGSKPSVSTTLPGVTIKFAEKSWKKFADEWDGKNKKNKDLNEWFVDNAKIAAIGGANTVDVYARLEEAGSNVNVTMWFDLGGGFVNSKDYPEKEKEAESLLRRFGVQTLQDMTKERINEEQDKLKNMEKKLRNLVSDNADYHKDIDNAKDKIRKAEASIASNEKDQATSKASIETQQKALESIKKSLDEIK